MPPPRGEGMTDSPPTGLPTKPGHRRWSSNDTPTTSTARTAHHNALLRLTTACAARRRRPGPAAATRSASGRSWTPTPRSARPEHAGEDNNEAQHPAHLTGPAPSGMTDSLTDRPQWTLATTASRRSEWTRRPYRVHKSIRLLARPPVQRLCRARIIGLRSIASHAHQLMNTGSLERRSHSAPRFDTQDDREMSAPACGQRAGVLGVSRALREWRTRRTFSTSARRRPLLGIGYGTAASRSGRITTLSCSFGSVRAPTATAGVVGLRLTATCGTPAGM